MSSIRISRRSGFPPFGKTVESTLGSLGLLAVRLVFGYGILLHGLPKIQNPFHWGDKAGIPSFFQLLAALGEFGGGLALIVGLLTRLGALGMMITMLVAIFTAHRSHPFVANGGGPSFETAALYAAVALLMVIAGPGRVSLDWKLFGDHD